MSSSVHPTFVGACLAGDALLEDIDDWVEAWHASSGQRGGQPISLDEFLGFTTSEGELWAERPESLRFIVAAHRYGQPVNALLQGRDGFALAARAEDSERARSVLAWLQQTGRLTVR